MSQPMILLTPEKKSAIIDAFIPVKAIKLTFGNWPEISDLFKIGEEGGQNVRAIFLKVEDDRLVESEERTDQFGVVVEGFATFMADSWIVFSLDMKNYEFMNEQEFKKRFKLYAEC